MITSKPKLFRSVTALLLALMMLLSVLPALAEAAETEPLIITEGSGPLSSKGGSFRPATSLNNDSAFSEYVRNAMYSRNGLSTARSSASTELRNRLSKDEQVLYDALLKKIKSVAAGKTASTHFKISSFKPKFTRSSVKNDLGVMYSKINTMVRNVIHALMGDCPSELYWYDKTCGAYWDWDDDHWDKSDCWISGFWIDFYVAKEYSAGNTTKTIKADTSKGTAVRKASENAQKIIRKYRGKSDVAKLKAYRDEICALNVYNTAAAQDEHMPYGNPWQLVWVFDGDPKTNVVCEGYSKAFQYLCELSSFSGNVTCLSMTGLMVYPLPNDQLGGGGHMWNVVTMPDNKRYLVDVTNCDQGSYGSDDLFLSGCAGTVDWYIPYQGMDYTKAYIYKTDDGSWLGYFFDTDMKVYTKKDRNLNLSAYNPASDTTKASGTFGTDTEWSLNKGVLQIGGTGAIPACSSGSPAPWKQYAGSIKKIVVGNSITEIGDNAFEGLKAAKSIIIGESVKKIGKNAFKGCKKLSSFTFKGTKLKTIGSKAFKGIPNKVTFICPAKKLNAYKKLLLKKGAPKTATFKK